MMVTDIIKPGDKIDIRLVQQIEQAENTGNLARLYKSQVYDVHDNGELEIAMPTEGGKVILLPLGIRFEFVFYSNGGLYRGEGQVKERFKKDNFFTLLVELKSQLVKFQRREFFRHECIIDMSYFDLTAEEAELESAEVAFDKIRDDHFYEKEKKGTIVDISGGGIRFTSNVENEINGYILISVRLSGEKIDKQYYLIGCVISCTRIEGHDAKYENRVQFLIRDNKIQEEIIKFIFDEERKTRNRN